MKKTCDKCGSKKPRHTTHQATNRRVRQPDGKYKTDTGTKSYPVENQRLCRSCA